MRRSSRHTQLTPQRVWPQLLLGAWLALPVLCRGQAVAGPDSQALLLARQANANWALPAGTYAGNRFITIEQIGKSNVGELREAWRTAISDDGEQEAAPIVWNGRMYVSTPHGGVLALDATTGKLLWHAPYNPAYVLLFAVNRGVGIADGNIFIATQDCKIVALDLATGEKVWAVQGCQDTSNSFYSMAAYVYKGQIIVGTGGGDNGTCGLVSAFSTKNGQRLWDWYTIPGPGEPGHETWPGDSWKHGGAAVWPRLAIDQDSDTLFVAPGNPGPDLYLAGRKGPNLYSDSLVALDISGSKPRIKWYYQLLANDTHDNDPAMIPVLFEGRVGRTMHHLVAIGDKAGDFVILDRETGQVMHRLAVSKQKNRDKPTTVKGDEVCPNHGGGIEWNGGAYDPASNLFIVPSTEECGVFKLTSAAPPQYIPGQPYEGGPLPKRRLATGTVSAIDVDTGRLRWRKAMPYPADGGVLITSTGLAFTSDVGGNVYAFDAATGEEYWKYDTHSAITAPLSAYSINGTEYLAVVVGQAGNQATPNLPKSEGSRVIAFAIGNAKTIDNGTTGQVALANVAQEKGSYAAGPPDKSTGTAPYTKEQVTQGAAAYAKECAVCHGAQLQGVSAPALTGPGFGRSHLTAEQLRAVVVQQMPLTAPASLTPDEYAQIMAYLLAYACVQPAGGGQQPFPSEDLPALQQVQLGSATCTPK